MRLFLAGDVMLGRGIDQVLARSVDPVLYEAYVRDARAYVALAERANGPIGAPLAPAAPWGEALAVLADAAPDARVVNLESAATAHGAPWPGKGIHYRMHPANVDVLMVASIDVAGLANNHVLDWGRAGLLETLAALHGVGIATAGAGADGDAAWRPAAVATPSGRLLVVAAGFADAGIPAAWAAAAGRAGVALVNDPSPAGADALAAHVASLRAPGARVVVSLHWGPNWGYDVPAWQRAFAHRLVETGGADVVHGHSSHHPKGLEVHHGRLILYGSGDLINDYEGIGGHDRYRGDLSLLVLPSLASDGALAALELVPMRTRRFRLERAPHADARWLARRLDEASRAFGTHVRLTGDAALAVDVG
ncbi:MAG: CapA family protein [Trueperaceae bacterium]|nr:CapA family protein [Trueperaceae bacterium]